MNKHKLSVLNLLDRSLTILYRTNCFKDFSFLSERGVFPHIIFSNYVPNASVTDRLSEFVLNYDKTKIKRGILISDEFCQKVWFFAILTVAVAKSLGFMKGNGETPDITDSVFTDSIESNYDWFKAFFPNLVAEADKAEINNTRGVLIPPKTIELADVNTNCPDCDVANFGDFITMYSIAFLIGHELSHVYLNHSYWEHTIEKENEADNKSITVILSQTPEDESLLARIGFLVPQMTLLFIQNLRVNKTKSHLDVDVRLFYLFSQSFNDAEEKWRIGILIASLIGIWAKLYQRKDFPDFDQIKENPIEMMRAFLASAKLKD